MKDLAREFNFDIIVGQYRLTGQAEQAHKLLKVYLSGSEGNLAEKLRDHRRKSIGEDETQFRDDVDVLLDFYSIIQVGQIANYFPANLPDWFKQEILEILGNADVRRYYEEYYPLSLPQGLLRVAQDDLHFNGVESVEGTILFEKFLLIVSANKDADIELFLWLLDSGSVDGYVLDDLWRVFQNRELIDRKLASDTNHPLNRALWGFIKYIQFLSDYKALLVQARRFTLLQSALWQYQAYWFSKMKDRLGEIISVAIDNIILAANNLDPGALIAGDSLISDESDVQVWKHSVEKLNLIKQDITFLMNTELGMPYKKFILSAIETKRPMNLLEKLLREKIEKGDVKFDIYVLKGFANDILRNVSDVIEPVAILPFDETLKLDLDKITNSFLDLITSIRQIHSNKPFYMSFESLLFLSREMNLDQLKKRFLVIENNFFNEYVNQSNYDGVDFEHTLDSGKEIPESGLFYSFYSNAAWRNGELLVQYIDGIPEEFSSVSKAYLIGDGPKSLKLESTSSSALPENTTLLQPFQIHYEELKRKLTEYELANQIFVIDKRTQFQREASAELNKFLSFIEQAGLKCKVLQVDDRIDTTYRPELRRLLKDHWNSEVFRTLRIYEDPDVGNELIDINQGAVVEQIVQQFEAAQKGEPVRDVLLTAPTGSGKSLLFQMPAMYLAERYSAVTIVISPLIALMKDQVLSLQRERGYQGVAFMNSELSLSDRAEVIDKIKFGDVSILYMSPELLLSYELSTFIGNRTLGLFVIDEAHLVTTWGRDFRVDYWYLGNFIRRIRKFHQFKFPVIAVTATAVYNGPNDMVFETLDSLSLENSIMYIGKVKREEIHFEIFAAKFGSSHEKEKISLTAKRVTELLDAGEKIIVYCPWKSQLKAIRDSLSPKHKELTGVYFSDLVKEIKNETYEDFKSGRLRAIVSTKAFGMGVDIDDITVVYHHAPSGHLADYVQEIGRLARKTNMVGKAMTNFNPKDLKFTKILYGLSSIKQFQVRLVLEKIVRLQALKQRRNLLMSVDDFQHIFNFEDVDVEQKVKSTLLLLEKDLLTKYRYNVLLARPKSLFTTVFVRLKNGDRSSFLAKYSAFCKAIPNAKIEMKDSSVYTIELDKIWEKYHSDVSFPAIKKEYFDKTLFAKDNLDISPQLKFTVYLNQSSQDSFVGMNAMFEKVEFSLAKFGGGFFKKQDLVKNLHDVLADRVLAKRIADLIVSVYSSPVTGIGAKHSQFVKTECFIQQKRSETDYDYRVISRAYPKVRSTIKNRFERMFGKLSDTEREQVFFLPADYDKNVGMFKMAYVLEAFGLGSYEVNGGEKPGVFVRINDPSKLKRLVRGEYSNNLLQEIDRQQKTSVQIMDYFFTQQMSDARRWSFIEAYFLGKPTEELIGESLLLEGEEDDDA